MSRRIELATLAPDYDLVVVGGGITGAGVLREAVRTGARVLLVEQNDFASGTSSWSSKLVHGGLRYLKTGQWRLTLESVRERQRLMHEAPGLVQPQSFLMPVYRGRKPSKLTMQLGLFIYDLMAGSRKSRGLSPAELLALEPQLRPDDLAGAVAYEDARTDDARLTLRLIFDSVALGATALNYVAAQLSAPGLVNLKDQLSGETREIRTKMLVQATGAWAQGTAGAPPLRPLRGSHFIFSKDKLPLRHAVSWLHPKDNRPVFAHPWEGAVVYGTTDLDHDGSLDAPRMSAAEAEYLLEGLRYQFPQLVLRAQDALSSYSGIRPIVAGGKASPSAESRESALWSAQGLVGITGGKLTTFRVTARQVLREAARQVPQLMPREDGPVFVAHPGANTRQVGRYGEAQFSATAVLPGTPYSLDELRHCLRHEQIVHLTDLLLRRTRIALVAPQGGASLLPQIQPLCQSELGWEAARWAQEVADYQQYWQRQHAPVIA